MPSEYFFPATNVPLINSDNISVDPKGHLILMSVTLLTTNLCVQLKEIYTNVLFVPLAPKKKKMRETFICLSQLKHSA